MVDGRGGGVGFWDGIDTARSNSLDRQVDIFLKEMLVGAWHVRKNLCHLQNPTLIRRDDVGRSSPGVPTVAPLRKSITFDCSLISCLNKRAIIMAQTLHVNSSTNETPFLRHTRM